MSEDTLSRQLIRYARRDVTKVKHSEIPHKQRTAILHWARSPHVAFVDLTGTDPLVIFEKQQEIGPSAVDILNDRYRFTSRAMRALTKSKNYCENDKVLLRRMSHDIRKSKSTAIVRETDKLIGLLPRTLAYIPNDPTLRLFYSRALCLQLECLPLPLAFLTYSLPDNFLFADLAPYKDKDSERLSVDMAMGITEAHKVKFLVRTCEKVVTAARLETFNTPDNKVYLYANEILVKSPPAARLW